ncbi:LysR family transcriptional regulator [Phyllobacterium sp. SB3]|uniref:LysR family transcriptional regulator n=1 Tax=Phyllobacterium sp. SB3 TaxID=3156073 RepID=UPI0032AECD4D
MDAAEFGELKAFLAVYEERGFRRAALRLAMSPSALSRTVRSLEERLGVRLLNRTTRSVAPTEAGSALQSRIAPMIGEMEAALRDVGSFQANPRGTVRVNLPQAAATAIILPKLLDFTNSFPEVRIDLVLDNNITDIVARGFDAGIRIGTQVSPDMVAVRLTPDFRMAVVASPRYLERVPKPHVPTDLIHHRCVTYKWDSTGTLFPWSFDGLSGKATVEVESVLTANDTNLLVSAATRDVGIAYVAEVVAQPYLVDGTLVRLLEGWCGLMPGFHLYYSSRRHMPAAMRAFINCVKL